MIGETGHPNNIGIRLAGDGTQVIRNRIGFNREIGVWIVALEDADPDPTNNLLQDNLVGTDATGNVAFPNGTGMVIKGNQNMIIANTISGSVDSGLDIFGNQNTLSDNMIGTNTAGTSAIPNFVGVIVQGVDNMLLRNLVSGNTVGISVASSLQTGTIPTGNIIKGNLIGTNLAGNSAIPNTEDGIVLSNARTTLIGGIGSNIPTDRNIISGNRRHGISLTNGSTQNRISGNYVGVGIDGTTALGNMGTGIRVGDRCSNTTIGGPEANAGNTIAYNGVNGISLANDAGNNNIIDPNRIFGNALAGIDIGENGLTPNDPTDADVGPNKLQNFPTFTLSITGGELIVNYRVDSAPQHSTYGTSGIYVEFFKADATGAGRDFLGSDHYLLSDYSNGLPGTRQKNLGNAASLGISAGDSLTATAMDADGNSSEFSPAFPVNSTSVTISGRVTTPSGLGLRNATVSLIASSGERRVATTSSFGIYNFADVPSGLSYTITVTSKRYRFAPRIQTITQSVSNMDFTGLE
ncbi:MAG: carboxypeptidase regulatory-like domain-containing protein [Pyrinomonadaceae bacterium]